MEKIIYSIVIILSFSMTSFGQNQSERKIGIEANVVWPFVPGVGIYNLRVPIKLWENEALRGDLVLGTAIRPKTTDDENAEEFSEFGLGIGYRQYLWKGLHVEPVVYFSYASEKNNKIDGQDYSGLAITTELYAGYKFIFFNKEKLSLYTIIQGGIGGSPYQDLGPATEEGGVFPVGSLLIGITF